MQLLNLKTKKLNKKAITLIELMIAIAITSSLIGITYNFYWFAYKQTFRGRNEIHLHAKLRIVLEKLEIDLRNAREIEKISKNHLVVKIFRDSSYYENHIVLNDDETTKRIEYKLVKGGSGHKDKITRQIDKQTPATIAKFDKINENIFIAYTFDLSDNIVIFDSVINDSYQRERISLVTIKLNLQENKTSLNLTGSVSPRYLFGKKKQPYWNFNKNAQK